LSTDFSINTIHCQTKLMAEYARVYGKDGFKMADGTHKITKYDMTLLFWMVIDCLLRSKFVGYTANFSENSDIILNGADVFFKCEAPQSTVDAWCLGLQRNVPWTIAVNVYSRLTSISNLHRFTGNRKKTQIKSVMFNTI
jgi:hypothetical protein